MPVNISVVLFTKITLFICSFLREKEEEKLGDITIILYLCYRFRLIIPFYGIIF